MPTKHSYVFNGKDLRGPLMNVSPTIQTFSINFHMAGNQPAFSLLFKAIESSNTLQVSWLFLWRKFLNQWNYSTLCTEVTCSQNDQNWNNIVHVLTANLFYANITMQNIHLINIFENNPHALIVDVRAWLYTSFPDASRTKNCFQRPL